VRDDLDMSDVSGFVKSLYRHMFGVTMRWANRTKTLI